MTLFVYELSFPSDLQADAVVQFMRTLATRPRRGFLMRADPVVLEVRSNSGQLSWRLGVTRRDHDAVLAGLRASLPDVRVERTSNGKQGNLQAYELRLGSHRRSVRTDNPDEVAAALLNALERTYRGEVLGLQWVVGPWL